MIYIQIYIIWTLFSEIVASVIIINFSIGIILLRMKTIKKYSI
jgi:hypothetical protein